MIEPSGVESDIQATKKATFRLKSSKMKFSTVILFVASVAAVALDTDVPPALSQPGRRGVDCGACDRLNFCPGKPNNNVECELDGCCKK
ncbi:hypothetical protein CNYM01_00395 [Colletotrichum nymphaeae SA-01]|uniref:Uncharacterized protein n=1 Tax=Colletotrichum nymphaeae SA-01 TaxID=1460502 RepID=A0A135RPK5_9PEZI|nr:hypothetical protein CNYM01_00395 [Colletotrichum nymphaeae SA-01]